jgi:translation initiation factor IF-2
LPVRIYELCHEFDLPTKTVLEACLAEGLDVKSHSSTVEEYEAEAVRRRLSRLAGGQPGEEEVPQAEAPPPEPPPAPEPPPVPEISPDEQLARARSLRTQIALPTRARAKPTAAGVKLGGPRRPPPRPGAEEPAGAPAACADGSPAEAASVTTAPEAEAPVSATAAVEAPPEAPAAAGPVEAPPAEAETAPAALSEAAAASAPPGAEAPPAVEVRPAAPVEEGRRAVRPIRKPGPKLAPRPRAPGPKLAPKPKPHPQAVRAPEAPPAPHPQAVGVGVPKQKAGPQRPGRARPSRVPAAATPAAPPVPLTEEEEAAKKGRRKGRKGAEEEAEGIRRAHAFRRRERLRQREEQDEISGVAGEVALTPTAASERVRLGRTGRVLTTRLARPPDRPAAVVEGPRKVVVELPITVKSLSAALGMKSSQIITQLMAKGVMASINDTLSDEQSLEIALAREVELDIRQPRTPADLLKDLAALPDDPASLVPRSPVVVFMGHVDHGKTSLMDYIRKTRVAQGEAGGITQHIGAYRVRVGERSITFLDTPGHAAFTAMRSRGARVTDVAVLVVAADDGVMPQTEEAINHAKAAEVPIVVAINKCDLPQANPMRVKQQLVQFGLQPEEWGGKTICVETSAVTGQNVDQLLESLLLEAEMKELRANPQRPALGTVIEAQLTEGFGPLATLLVQNGTLKPGNVVLAGTVYGKVRALSDENGRRMKEAAPSVPVRVAGLTGVPEAGDRFYVLAKTSLAKQVAEDAERRLREAALAESRRPRTLEAAFEQMAVAPVKELALIIKADVQGSVEALRENLEKIEHPEVRVRVIHAAAGGVNESDVLLADASNAFIIGFNVAADLEARLLAEKRGVDIRPYQIIYNVTDDVRKALEGLLTPQQQDQHLGECHVVQTFKISRVGTVAGCKVTDGVIARNARIRVIRDGVVIHTGAIQSLKRVKDDAREVRAGLDCGVHMANFDDIKVGDRLEAFETVSVARTL